MTFTADIRTHGTCYELTNQRAAFWQESCWENIEGVSTRLEEPLLFVCEIVNFRHPTPSISKVKIQGHLLTTVYI